MSDGRVAGARYRSNPSPMVFVGRDRIPSAIRDAEARMGEASQWTAMGIGMETVITTSSTPMPLLEPHSFHVIHALHVAKRVHDASKVSQVLHRDDKRPVCSMAVRCLDIRLDNIRVIG